MLFWDFQWNSTLTFNIKIELHKTKLNLIYHISNSNEQKTLNYKIWNKNGIFD